MNAENTEWRKSRYSGGNGGACVEVTIVDHPQQGT